ncbi:MAG TPA: DoxX family protein [Actinomycetota bacterium]|nr:DoxX family protein [Actinomycetota bacterium]
MTGIAAGLLLAGRIVFSLFFLMSAWNHLVRAPQMEGYAKSVGFPFPQLAGWPSALWLFASAVSVGAGIWPDVGALMIAAWMVPTALFFHPFWKVEDPMQRMTQTQLFWRNVTFLGAALALLAVFAGLGDGVPFSVTGAALDL